MTLTAPASPAPRGELVAGGERLSDRLQLPVDRRFRVARFDDGNSTIETIMKALDALKIELRATVSVAA